MLSFWAAASNVSWALPQTPALSVCLSLEVHIRDGATDFTMSLPSMVGTPAGCPPRERFYTGFGPASLTGAVTEVAENPSYQISFAWIEM